MSWDGYKTRRWRKLRERVLRRDQYQCQEAKRYGRTVQATTVHHVYPAEDYPEYAWQSWNLISLTQSAHEAMHDRTTRALTAAGRRWQRRVHPPSF